MKLLMNRESLDKVLSRTDLSVDERKKLELSKAAREFAITELNLNAHKNYSTYVKLEKPYVTWVINASPKWELKHHLWSFPIIGEVPYKGYWSESEALEEESRLKKQDLDTFVRGVSAFSTLGWFNDPILSSMLRYQDSDLVNTIIHESVHATLYIKHNADFNERLASFIGDTGAELFYLKKEGPDSPTLKQIKLENEDSIVFSNFISSEIKNLGEYYKTLPISDRKEELRDQSFNAIKEHFNTQVKPLLKTSSYTKFEKTHLSNARLLLYKTYTEDLTDFKTLLIRCNNDLKVFIERVKILETSSDPIHDIKDLK
jgi:predicted aminopeptidase